MNKILNYLFYKERETIFGNFCNYIMGCTVSKNDVKNRKVKIRFIPYKPREVRTELDLNPHSNESRLSQLKPISKSDPLDTPLVLKP